MKNKDELLIPMRHTLAHILMQALMRLYKDARPGVGPAIENGFYHDFFSKKKISIEDLPKIEAEMYKIIKENLKIEKIIMPIEEGIEWLKEHGYQHTLELAEDLKKAGVNEISFYRQGEFMNMCKGPHVESTSQVGFFKLTKLAGAYWKGDENREMMQRIYGVAFQTKEELDQYLKMLEEAKKRDHRQLGKDLDLFTFSDLVGSGLPLWTPKGTILRNLLDQYVWELRKPYGFEKVEIPHITKKDLYETSGHWAKFKDELFKITTREGHLFAMKPMNCPHHTQIYKHLPRSFRDLPQRYANTTMVYRDEQSGELSGLSRVRCITQDDAHIFCRKSQIKQEMSNVWNVIDKFYKTFGFSDLQVRLSFHDPENFVAYLGSKEVWNLAEKQLKELVEERGVKDYFIAFGEAAFYGPKIDFIAKDSLQREWQVATIQLDMNMPENFDLTCVNEQGENERIVMIHCAIMGSIERFLSIIIEHFAGAFPLWLAPVQLQIIPVGEKYFSYSQKLAEDWINQDLRVFVDYSAETVSKKIRNATKQKIPYILVIGEKEVSSADLSVRVRGKKDLLNINKDEFLKMILQKNKNKSLDL